MMNRQHFRQLFSAANAIVLLFGLAAGVLVLNLGGADLKWVVYFAGGLGFVALLFALPERQRFLGAMFLLSFQLDLQLRVMYGRADSHGLALQFTSVFGLMLLFCLITRGDATAGRPWRWLGDGALRWALILTAATFLIGTGLSGSRFIGITAIFTYLQYYLIFWIALNTADQAQEASRAIKLLIVTLLLQALVYCLQSALGITFTLTGAVLNETELPRPGGTVGTTPATFATFIFPLFFIAVAAVLSQHLGRGLRWFAGFAAALGGVALILTFTRGAWAAAALGMVWLIFFALRYRIVRPWLVTAITTAAVLAALVAVPIIMGSRDDNPLESAFDERFALMQMAISVIEAHPLSGVGPGAYGVTFKRYLPPELANSWLFIVHNNYLLVAAEQGLIGAAGLILWLWAGIFMGLRIGRDSEPAESAQQALVQAAGLGCSAAFVALAFEMYWEPLNGLYGMTGNVPYWYLLGFMAAHLRPAARPQPASPAPRARRIGRERAGA